MFCAFLCLIYTAWLDCTQSLRRNGKSPLSLLEAEAAVNEKIASALQTGTRQAVGRPHDPSSTTEEDRFWAAEAAGLQNSSLKSEAVFRAEQLKRLTRGLVPDVNVYLCMQMDIDLSAIALPGLNLNIAIQGGIHNKLANGCWGLTLEAVLGFEWGFKVYGYGVGVGVSVTGSIDLTEVPANAALQDPAAYTREQTIYAPEGADLNKCHTRNPWTLVQTYVEHQYRRYFKESSNASKEVERLKREVYAQKQKEFEQSYAYLLNGSMDVFSMHAGARNTALFHAPRLLGPAVAQLKAGNLYFSNLPSYAGQVMRRLADNSKYFGTDGELCITSSRSSCKRLRATSGRFLARWPSRGRLNEVFDFEARVVFEIKNCSEERANGKWMEDGQRSGRPRYTRTNDSRVVISWSRTKRAWRLLLDEKNGSTLYKNRQNEGEVPMSGWESLHGNLSPPSLVPIKARVSREQVDALSREETGSDQRVLNFAKAMRMSKHREKAQFWKEIAMSASNLLVRVIGDVKALFGAAFAEDTDWDGSCESLPVKIRIGESLDKDILSKYRWAARTTINKDRASFANFDSDFQGKPYARVLRDFGQLFSPPSAQEGNHMYPHFWCTLASHAPRKESDQHQFHIAEKPVEVSSPQACQTVVRETRDLENEDTLVWDGEKNVYDVLRDGVKAGILQKGCQDTPGWIDLVGNTCSSLKEKGVCSFGSISESHEWIVGQKHNFPNKNCCECGKFDESVNQDTNVCEDCIEAVGGEKIARQAKLKGYVVTNKVVDARPECERVVLPVAFVRMFPRFTTFVLATMEKMERILLEMNACLNEELDFSVFHSFPYVASLHGSSTLKEWKVACDTLKKQQDHARDIGITAVRLARKFLFRLGAEDPRKSVTAYSPGVLPVNDEERAILNGEFASLVYDMAQDFVDAFGLAIVEGDKVHPQTLPEDSLVKPQQKPMQRSAASQDSRSIFLRGHFWMHCNALKPKILQIAQPLERIAAEHARLIRPPLLITNAVTVTGLMNHNNFCARKSALILVEYVDHTTRRTWSPHVSNEKCFIGRLRPGSTWVQVQRCSGSSDGGGFVDWRVRIESELVKGNILGGRETGVIGNILTSPNGIMPSVWLSGASVVGGAASMQMVDKFSPYLFNSTAISALLMTVAAATPLAGTIGVAAGIASLSTFEGICERFMSHLKNHDLLYDPFAGPGPVFQLDIQLIVWVAVVHRQKFVQIQGDGAPVSLLRQQSAGHREGLVRTQKFFSMHVINKNRFSFGLPIPGAVSVFGYFNLHLDWDLTPWIERVQNQRIFREHQARMSFCFNCLRNGMGFCDWKPVLASLWQPEMDECIEHTDYSEEDCVSDIGIHDDYGNPIHALYFSPLEAGAEQCSYMVFRQYNTEFRAGDNMRRFLDRN